MKTYTNENGRSLVEMMGYMTVVMVVIVGVGRIVSNAFEEHKFSQASIQLSEFAGAISRAGAIDPDYTDVVAMINGTYNKSVNAGENTTKNNEGLKLIPRSYRLIGREIHHIFGGKVDVGTQNNRFYITYYGLQRRQCIELALKGWEKNKSVDLYSVTVNDDSWYWPIYHKIQSANHEHDLPVTRAAVAGIDDNGQCSKTDNNVITWMFN